MKRLITLLGVALLLAATLTGCDNNATNNPNDNADTGNTERSELPYTADPTEYGYIAEHNNNGVILSWQEAYASLLRDYAGRKLGDYYDDRIGGFFILHDIDRDGIPELIVANSFHFTYYLTAYTFENNGVIPIYVESFADYSPRLSVPPNNRPGIITRFSEGLFSVETLMVMDGHRLVSEVVISHENVFLEGFHRWHIDGTEVSEAEYNSVFENVFGTWYETERIYIHEITDDNIERVIFGSEQAHNADISDQFTLTLSVEEVTVRHGETLRVDVELQNNSNERHKIVYSVGFMPRIPGFARTRFDTPMGEPRFFEAGGIIRNLNIYPVWTRLLEPGTHELTYYFDFWIISEKQPEEAKRIRVESDTVTFTVLPPKELCVAWSILAEQVENYMAANFSEYTLLSVHVQSSSYMPDLHTKIVIEIAEKDEAVHSLILDALLERFAFHVHRETGMFVNSIRVNDLGVDID